MILTKRQKEVLIQMNYGYLLFVIRFKGTGAYLQKGTSHKNNKQHTINGKIFHALLKKGLIARVCFSNFKTIYKITDLGKTKL